MQLHCSVISNGLSNFWLFNTNKCPKNSFDKELICFEVSKLERIFEHDVEITVAK